MLTVTLFEVKTNSEKLTVIAQTVQQHYNREEAVLILVPNAEAALYMDQLLWKMPSESFLPHEVSNQAGRHPILITTSPQNLNQALVLINLCPETSPIAHEFQHVYDLYDRTHPSKEKLAHERQNQYKQWGWKVDLATEIKSLMN